MTTIKVWTSIGTIAALTAGCADTGSASDGWNPDLTMSFGKHDFAGSPRPDFSTTPKDDLVMTDDQGDTSDLVMSGDSAMPGDMAMAVAPDLSMVKPADLTMGPPDLVTGPPDMAMTMMPPDMATMMMMPLDMAMMTMPPDMAMMTMPPDMAMMTMPPDMAMMTMPPDLATPPDMTMVVSCKDGIKNGMETDVDCGGAVCPTCAAGKKCILDSDCASNFCLGKVCTAAPTFKTSTVNVGNGPWGLVVADWNNDAIDDIAVANNKDNNVSVLIGIGNGTFKAAVNYSVGQGPNVLNYDDFNGDGIWDLVTSNGTDNNVSVLIGNANGTFKAKVNTTVGTNPQFVQTGYFDADAKVDIFVANYNDDTIQQLAGDGTGKFTSKGTFAEKVPLGIAAGDWNGDMNTDVIATKSGGNQSSVFFGPTFKNPTDYTVGMGPAIVVAGDLNSDGFLDMIVSNFTDGTVSILLGTAKGVFGAAATYAAGKSPEFITGADYNRDAKLDLIVANVNGNNFSLLVGNNDGTVHGPINYATGKLPRGIDTGDFNGDGKPDVAVANNGDGTVTIVLNTN